MKELLRKLTETYGPSGSEGAIRDTIRQELAGAVDEVRTDALGNLIAVKHGDGQGLNVMLAAHMDEIGVIVSHIDEKGFLRFQPLGGVFPLNLNGGRVVFANGVTGALGLEKLESNKNVPDLDKFFIDVGATSKANAPVKIGDTAGFTRPFAEAGDRYIAKSMDNRSGCAVLIETLRRLQDSPHEVYAVFTVQEELGLRGARTSAFGVDPDLALAIDVTGTGDTPEAATMAVSLGAGAAIKVKDSGMLTHPRVKELLIRTAEAERIPYQLEILDRRHDRCDGHADDEGRRADRRGVDSLPVPALALGDGG